MDVETKHTSPDMIGAVAGGMQGERPRYRGLIADNGLDSGARS